MRREAFSGCLCIVRQPENEITPFQVETFAKRATDGASAARRHVLNPSSPVKHDIGQRTIAALFQISGCLTHMI